MDGPKVLLFVTHNSFSSYDACFVLYLQTASSLAYAAVSGSVQQNLLQVPLWSRSNSTESSLARDNSTNDEGYMVLLCIVIGIVPLSSI